MKVGDVYMAKMKLLQLRFFQVHVIHRWGEVTGASPSIPTFTYVLSPVYLENNYWKLRSVDPAIGQKWICCVEDHSVYSYGQTVEANDYENIEFLLNNLRAFVCLAEEESQKVATDPSACHPDSNKILHKEIHTAPFDDTEERQCLNAAMKQARSIMSLRRAWPNCKFSGRPLQLLCTKRTTADNEATYTVTLTCDH